MGYWADRTGGAQRRKIWFAAGIPLILAGTWMILVPPAGAGAGHLAIWGLILSIGTTATGLAYAAWGAELTPDYAERNRVAFRETVTVIGTVLVTATPALLPAFGFTRQMDVLWAIAIAIAVLLPTLGLLAIFTVPEPEDRSVTRLDWREGFGHLWRTGPSCGSSRPFSLNGLANGLPASLFCFFVAERLGRRAGAFVPARLFLLCRALRADLAEARRALLEASHLGLGHADGERRIRRAAILPTGALVAYGIICVLGLRLGRGSDAAAFHSGRCGGCRYGSIGRATLGLLFRALGSRAEGGLALAVGIAFPLLAWAGFDPANGQKTESGLAMLAFLYAGLPVALKLAATALVWGFPIDGVAQAACA